jgi:hypothetical protein
LRSNMRFGAWLALVAMALQLVLSFGHTHFNVAGGDDVLTPVVASNLDPVAPHPVAPAKHSKFTDLCAICANIHLAGSIEFPHAVVLPLPPVSGYERPEWRGVFRLVSPPHLYFDARGPPLA